MHSFVIKIAIEVKRAVELVIIISALGFNVANVLKLIVEADPIKISVINIRSFFLFNFYISSYIIHYQF